jgi:predicted amidohydrolase YtcJ
MRHTFCHLSVALLLVCGVTRATTAEPVDLLVTNARIATMDADFSFASSMAIRGDRVVATGGAELKARFEATRTLDLGGRFVMPGFVDSHIHMSGNPPWHIDLTKVRSIVEINTLVKERAAQLPKGHWITGYGWSEDALAEKRRPLRDDLDDAAPDNPVGLTRAGAHSAVFNSAALAAGKVDESSPQPESGVIEKGDDGRLNGIIRERHDMLLELAPVATDDIVRASFIENLQGLFRLGITSIVQAQDSIDHYPEWERVYRQRRGTLPRAAVQVAWAGAEKMRVFGRKTGDGDEHLRLGAIKVFVDGGFTGPAAFTKKPYRGMGDYHGSLTMGETQLARIFSEAHAAGWQLGVHAIGDAAIELAVKELAAVIDRSPRADHRHYLNHFTIKPSEGTMADMARHGIAITQQPNFTYTLEGRYAAYLDAPELASNNPLRSPMRHGIHLAISSDILPIGPMTGLYAAVTRKGMSGAVHGAEEALTIREALNAYTQKGAWLTFEERQKGTLEAGKLADFIVLSADPVGINPDLLMEVRVDETWLGGVQVWSRPFPVGGNPGAPRH